MKFLPRVLAAMLLLIVISCNQRRQLNAHDDALENLKTVSDKPEEARNLLDSTYAPPEKNENKQNRPGNNQQPKIDWDKKIVKNGTLRLEVKKIDEYNTLLRDVVRGAGGYIAQEEQNSSDYKLENTVTVKVPVDQFESVISSLTSKQDKIIERKIGSEDVTGEVVDTKSRIEARKRIRDKYLDLLKQARNMEEILQVQNEINDIQEQIEAASGRVDYLTHAAAMSTIHLTYFQIIGEVIPDDKAPGFGERVLNAFKNGGIWIGEFLILLVNLWPVFLGLVVLVIALRRIKPKTKSI